MNETTNAEIRGQAHVADDHSYCGRECPVGRRQLLIDALVDQYARMDVMAWLGTRRGDREHDEPISQRALAAVAVDILIPLSNSAT